MEVAQAGCACIPFVSSREDYQDVGGRSVDDSHIMPVGWRCEACFTCCRIVGYDERKLIVEHEGFEVVAVWPVCCYVVVDCVREDGGIVHGKVVGVDVVGNKKRIRAERLDKLAKSMQAVDAAQHVGRDIVAVADVQAQYFVQGEARAV